jgi:hypothetical protein
MHAAPGPDPCAAPAGRQVVAVLPSNPVEQLRLAHAITCHAYSGRVTALEAEVGRLRRSAADKAAHVRTLETRLTSLQLELQDALDKARRPPRRWLWPWAPLLPRALAQPPASLGCVTLFMNLLQVRVSHRALHKPLRVFAARLNDATHERHTRRPALLTSCRRGRGARAGPGCRRARAPLRTPPRGVRPCVRPKAPLLHRRGESQPLAHAALTLTLRAARARAGAPAGRGRGAAGGGEEGARGHRAAPGAVGRAPGRLPAQPAGHAADHAGGARRAAPFRNPARQAAFAHSLRRPKAGRSRWPRRPAGSLGVRSARHARGCAALLLLVYLRRPAL